MENVEKWDNYDGAEVIERFNIDNVVILRTLKTLVENR